jgi:cobaltochelatase CobS
MVPCWHHIECINVGPDGWPVDKAPQEPPQDIPQNPQDPSGEDISRDVLEGMSTVDLRTKARTIAKERGESRITWIASAKKQDLISYLVDGFVTDQGHPREKPQPVDEPVSEDGDAITRLITQVAEKAAVKAARETETKAKVDLDQIKRMVEDAVCEFPAVKIELPSGEVQDVRGEHPLYTRLLTYLGAGIRTWVAGPAGSGKTTAAERAADSLKLAVFIQTPCATPYDVLGYKDAHGNVVETEFSRWCRYDGAALLILDEVDGWLAPAQLAANAALANGWAVLPEGRIKVHGNGHLKPVVATANTWGLGANAEYNGRTKLDAAFRNRFDAKLWWGYDNAFEVRLAVAHAPEDKRDAVKALVERIQRIRKNIENRGIRVVVSPRQSIACAKLLSMGQAEDDLLSEVILAELDESQRQEVLS